MIEGATQLGGRMRKMMGNGGSQLMDAVEEMMPGDMA
jgi:hypothetical protein